jgi:hypothetical protein
MAIKAHHPLTRAEYQAEGPNAVRVIDGDTWGLFDRFGAWIEGEMRQCDPQMCIWLTGLAIVEERDEANARSTESAK